MNTKRLFDIAAVILSAPLTVPLILLLMAIVRVRIGRPVFFTQTRPGLGGRPFQLIKFRTMTNARDGEGAYLPDNKRLTSFGRFLRASSLDELPELCNILKGEMSLVGPRPLLMQYLERYSMEQARRHDVRPGITGWAQIHGRNAVAWEERFALDVWYVDNHSLWLDLRILARTLSHVIRREGISAEGHATMPEFMGGGDDGGGEKGGS